MAGGGVAGLAAALATARSGHQAVVLERDAIEPAADPFTVFDEDRGGIPQFFQPHALRRAASRESAIELRPAVTNAGLAVDEGGAPRATRVSLEGGEVVRGHSVRPQATRACAASGDG